MMPYKKTLLSIFVSILLIACSVQPGEKIPDPEVKQYQGKSGKLSDFIGKEYTLIDFWGTWCGPCIEALPKLREAYEKVDKDKVEFISICYDCDKSIEELIEKHKMVWTQIDDLDGLVTDAFGVKVFPSIYLIDSQGKVVIDSLDPDNMIESLTRHTK